MRYCDYCGSPVDESSDFCGNCGHVIEKNTIASNTGTSVCRNCGAPLAPGNIFCDQCGTPVNSDDIAVASEAKKNMVVPIVIIILVVIAVVSTIAGYAIYTYMAGEEDGQNSPSNGLLPAAAPTSTVSIPTIAPSTPTPAPTLRPDLYRASLTYKRMPEIHNTVLADDAAFNELKNVIISFDDQCCSYMNGYTSAVPSYLMPGSTAYNQQVQYKQKHPTLYQTYEKIDVINARTGGGYYYVWVTERIRSSENGKTQTRDDHWVYKIGNYNGQWYIYDYTADPLFSN